MRIAALRLIRLYQRVVSPYLPAMCRFDPSCSQYTADAVERYGIVQGIWLGFRRLLRCRPMGGQGYDPVT
jgi:putative membrane protein insertion efficiency factor